MKTGSFINGEWIVADSDRVIRNINPADPADLIAEFPSAGRGETDAAIDHAATAYEQWHRLPTPERGRYIARVAELARKRKEEIAGVITREEGKILREALGEVQKGINILEYYHGAGFRMEGFTRPSEVQNCFAYTIRRSLGVVGLITPWNFPWAIPCWKIAPALVAGNTVVFKPAELTPGTAALLVELFEEAGVPRGVLNMVVGPGSVVGEAIVGHGGIKAVSFTGSNGVGQRVIEIAARTRKKVTCEMGGKNALIVMPDADIDAAVVATAEGAFGSTGQRCTATSRVLVHKEVKHTFMEKLLEQSTRYNCGDGMCESTGMGPSVEEKQMKMVLAYIEAGKKEGARLVTGGNRVEMPGFFIESTIFDRVTPEMRIFQEEIFGPVLAVSEFSTLEEAIALNNNSRYGFTGALFSNDIRRIMRYIEEAEIRMVHVNEPTIGGEAQLPFGGCKDTGYGDREMADDGLNFFTQTKTVFINYAGSGEREMVR